MVEVGGKLVYVFGAGKGEGQAGMASLLGGKGAHLAEMSMLGIPVPPGFTITTDVCAHFTEHGTLPDSLRDQVAAALAGVEQQLMASFGDSTNPLLVSVRSGAPVSMPGMMDTVLNLGLNDETVEGLARRSGDDRFAWDSYRRFVQMFGSVVMGIDSELFHAALEQAKQAASVEADADLSADALRALTNRFLSIFREATGTAFPTDPQEQLWSAIDAVFRSWMGNRAVVYRRHHRIPDSLGTAVTVQAMVFGNAGDDCATGVAFSRNPATGERALYGEFLVNAQGEDVVAGIRTPQSITAAAADASGHAESESLERVMPAACKELQRVSDLLEQRYRDAQDMEFTVHRGRLWMLQTRTAKRTAAAAIQMAVDMVEEGLITVEEALQRVEPLSLNQLLHPSFDPDAHPTVLAVGLPASPGAASGRIALRASTAVEMAADGPSILVRHETSPEDIEGMIAAQGILTARGGMTSHAAVVARGLGTTCVSGCGELHIDYDEGTVTVAGHTLREGEWLSIDGTTGEVLLGEVATVPPRMTSAYERFMVWGDRERRLGVHANADTPRDAQIAREFGATGIGLCRTEHMFFEDERITHFRRMILASTDEERSTALDALLPMQRADFAAIFAAMDGLPVTVRLLDPPLHEFLPHTPEGQAELAAITGLSVDDVAAKVENLREANPMLGHRGCRLGVTYPGIYGMQTRAIVEAALDELNAGRNPHPEIMVPLVGSGEELEKLAAHVRAVIREVTEEHGASERELNVRVGTMIEVPRACVVADEIAREAEFFSFGTNDLTQMTYGFSRDDAGVFLPAYIERGIIAVDPFQSVDERGVGEFMQMAVERGRTTRSNLTLGVCGEHGGDPDSIGFFHRLGVDYVSCSPYRVPIARLAGAQAAIRERHGRDQRSSLAKRRSPIDGQEREPLLV